MFPPIIQSRGCSQLVTAVSSAVQLSDILWLGARTLWHSYFKFVLPSLVPSPRQALAWRLHCFHYYTLTNWAGILFSTEAKEGSKLLAEYEQVNSLFPCYDLEFCLSKVTALSMRWGLTSDHVSVRRPYITTPKYILQYIKNAKKAFTCFGLEIEW